MSTDKLTEDELRSRVKFTSAIDAELQDIRERRFKAMLLAPTPKKRTEARGKYDALYNLALERFMNTQDNGEGEG